MRSIFIVGILLMTVSVVSSFGGCGCRRSEPPPPPPCEPEPEPSCEQEPEVCTPCPSLPKRVCAVCPEPIEFKCRDCPTVSKVPPCPICEPQPVCEVCEVCPEQVEPPPCPVCSPPPPPAKCPVCPAPEPVEQPQCPPSPPPQAPAPCRQGGARRPPPPQYGNDCCNKCGSSCLLHRRLRAHAASTLVENVDPTCNSEKLRKIILNNIADNITESKRAIQKVAHEKLTGEYDVICASGDFSYVISSNKFCQETKNDITCYVFRQA